MTKQTTTQKNCASDGQAKKLTVFVSGLNYHTTEEEITNFFSKCGKIERINLAKKDGSNANQGFCHIIYVDEEGYSKALALNGSKLDGRYLDIITAKGPTKIEKIKEKLKSSKNVTLFVRNIPYDTTEEEIKGLFQKYGTIRAIRLPLCRDDPTKLKGICFIDFENPQNLIKALELDGYSLRGRFLKLDADISYDDATGTKIKTKTNQPQQPAQQVQQPVSHQMMTQQHPEYAMYYQNQQSWANYQNYQMMQQQGPEYAQQHQQAQQYTVAPPPGFAPAPQHDQQAEYYAHQTAYHQNFENQAYQGYPVQQVSEISQETSYPQQTQYEQAYADFDALYDPKKFEHLSRRNYSGLEPEYEMQMSSHQPQETYQRERHPQNVQNVQQVAIPQNQEHEAMVDIVQKNATRRRSSDSDYIINPNGKLRSMIDETMEKELEEFRINNNIEAKVSMESRQSAGTEESVSAFAEAVLGLSTFVQKSTDPLDKVLNPFAKDGKSGEKAKDLAKFLPNKNSGNANGDLSKKLSKFSAQKDASPKATGFSLSRFWKKK